MDTPNAPADSGSGVTSPQAAGNTGLPENPRQPKKQAKKVKTSVAEDPEIKQSTPRGAP